MAPKMTLILALVFLIFVNMAPKMTLILALASSNFCEYGPKNYPNFDRPKMSLILTGQK